MEKQGVRRVQPAERWILWITFPYIQRDHLHTEITIRTTHTHTHIQAVPPRIPLVLIISTGGEG